MKEKLKKINFTLIGNILKASLIGVVTSIILVLIFAFVLKFVDLNSHVISLVDQIIKLLSVVVAVLIVSRVTPENLLIKAVLTGVIYSILSFVVFSIMNGGVHFTVAVLTDLAFCGAVGGIFAILLNIFRKK